jgi:hypothetical protein
LSVCRQVNGKTVFWKCWKLSPKIFTLHNLKLVCQDDFSGLVSSFKLPHNGLQLQEVGDFEAQNCLPPLNLIRSTKLHLTTEPPISCRCCYRAFFFSRCPYIPSYAVKYSAIVSHFVTVNSCYFLSAKKLFKLSNRNFIFFNAKSRNDYGVLHL